MSHMEAGAACPRRARSTTRVRAATRGRGHVYIQTLTTDWSAHAVITYVDARAQTSVTIDRFMFIYHEFLKGLISGFRGHGRLHELGRTCMYGAVGPLVMWGPVYRENDCRWRVAATAICIQGRALLTHSLPSLVQSFESHRKHGAWRTSREATIVRNVQSTTSTRLRCGSNTRPASRVGPRPGLAQMRQPEPASRGGELV